MTNLNGQLILDALQTLEQPATLQNIVSVVAKTCGTTPDQVHETVKRTLYGGVRHGFVQYANRKYYAADYEAEDDDSGRNGEDQPRDASRRRRRGSRRRSGSRRRRSRRRRSRR